MYGVGFEFTILASEQAKTVYALDLSSTVTGEYTCKNLSGFIPQANFTERATAVCRRS
jgi:hypothetical protein